MKTIAAWSSRVLNALRHRLVAGSRDARSDAVPNEVALVKGYAVLVSL